MRKIGILFLASILIILSACGSSSDGELDKIVLADAGWDSIRIHNSIAQIIMEEGFGYDTEVTSGSSTATVQGLRQGDINAYMEIWTDNIKELYEEATEAGDFETVSGKLQ